MTSYAIYKHPDGRLEAIKDGFSFPGAIFGAVWLLWHKIWVLGSIGLIGGLALYGIFPSPEGYLMGMPYGHKFGLADALNLAGCILVGAFGNQWRESSLIERGFDNISVEHAESADGAKGAYLRSLTSNQIKPTERIEPSAF